MKIPLESNKVSSPLFTAAQARVTQCSPPAHRGHYMTRNPESNQIKSIFVILYLLLSTQINITTGYLVLCKQDLFRYNIIRRNRSYKIKIRIKSYISGYCKFNASKIFYPTCF